MVNAHDVFNDFCNSQLKSKSDHTPEQLKNLEHAFHAGLAAMANHAIPVIKFAEMIQKRKKGAESQSEINDFIQEKLKEQYPDINTEIHTINSGSPLDSLIDMLGESALDSFKKDFKSFCRQAQDYAEEHFTDPNEKPPENKPKTESSATSH